ncbi:hypothetical protein D3C81_1781770 [compost metagenome]
MLELKGHIQLAASVADIIQRLLRPEARRLPDSHNIVEVQHLVMQILQQRVDMREVREHIIGAHGCRSAGIQCIRVALRLHDMGNRVKPEAVNAFFEPPLYHFMQLVDHRRVLPVQIGLIFGVQMQVILIRPGIKLPYRAAEIGFPVVRGAAVFAFPPYIVISLRIVLRAP